MTQSFLKKLQTHKSITRSSQILGVFLKSIAILSSALAVPFLVNGHGVRGFALFSLVTALVYTISSVDFGIANLINSTSTQDLVKVKQLFQLAQMIIIFLLTVYLSISLLSYLLYSAAWHVFVYFRIPYIFFASFLVVLNNIGLKLLLMDGKVRKYQLLQPAQLIVSNIFVLFTASRLSLEMIFIVSTIFANFVGSFFAVIQITKNAETLNLQLTSTLTQKNFSSLAIFQYLQLLSIFNSQGTTLLISRFFSLQVVAIYSLSTRIFQSVNQVYAQLIADYWNEISRLKFLGDSKRLFMQYMRQIRKSIWYGGIINGCIVILGPLIFREFLSLKYDFHLFFGLAFYWTCTLVFMPISFTFNGLLHAKGQLLSQSIFSLTNLFVITFFGLFNLPLSISIIVLGSINCVFVLPLSHHYLKKYLNSTSVESAAIS